jgi:hypothetical protein
VYLDIKNREDNHLGIPLPKGIVRVYKADKSGAKQFIGEDEIDHTPRDEKVRIKMGDAFDVVGDRKQMSYTPIANNGCIVETEWQITLRNHKDTAQVVEDIEPVGGDWTISNNTDPYVTKDAFTFSFTVTVPARGEKQIAYKAHIKWC